MRVLVTGASNEFGRGVAATLAAAGQQVRAFGIPAGQDPFHHANVQCFPGDVEVGGSMEPAASECQAIVHCANLDDAPRSRLAKHILDGTRYARYAAERELVDHLVVLLPTRPPAAARKAVEEAEALVRAARVPHTLLAAETPQAAAQAVAKLLANPPVPTTPL